MEAILTTSVYLGVLFSSNRRFVSAMKMNVDKGRKAFYALMRNCKEKDIPIDCIIELFSKTIDPILVYGCEIYGFENCQLLEKFRLQCLKAILRVRTSTPSYMVLAETGLPSLESVIRKRMIGFWSRLVSHDTTNLASTTFSITLQMYLSHDRTVSFPWLQKIQKVLNDTGYTFVWNSQSPSQLNELLMTRQFSH